MSKIRTYESNSQLYLVLMLYSISCSWCQRYELMRAIHNPDNGQFEKWEVVPDVKDTNLWEQFTTNGIPLTTTLLLFLMSKIRTYESNSQPEMVTPCFFSCCSWCQRYELMRAIHNAHADLYDKQLVVPDVKDTNLWEQFTTHNLPANRIIWLFLMSKIRTYESNSQPTNVRAMVVLVVPDVKDTNLWEQFTTT